MNPTDILSFRITGTTAMGVVLPLLVKLSPSAKDTWGSTGTTGTGTIKVQAWSLGAPDYSPVPLRYLGGSTTRVCMTGTCSELQRFTIAGDSSGSTSPGPREGTGKHSVSFSQKAVSCEGAVVPP
jgi:hypothetical protein